MQTGRSSTRRAVRSRLAENEVTHTRSHDPVRRSTSASGSITGASFRSMLNRTSGHAASRSSSRGMGSVPAIRASATVRYGSRAIRPPRSVTRSSVRSWNATSTPSAVACRSVSRYQ